MPEPPEEAATQPSSQRPAPARGLPRMALERGRVLFVSSGAIGVTALPEWALVLRLRYGWSVRVCLSYSADRLVSRSALAAVTQAPVEGPDWPTERGVVPHQELAEWPDLVIAAPATTNFVAKCAAGMADSLALTTVLCTAAPVLIAPSIPENALARPAVQRNLRLLEEDGYHVVPMSPAVSAHRGTVSPSGMPGLPAILKAAARVLAKPEKPEKPEEGEKPEEPEKPGEGEKSGEAQEKGRTEELAEAEREGAAGTGGQPDG